jgi:uncharacterized protein
MDRKDHTINLFEMKFYNTIWTIDKAEAEDLKEKGTLFKTITKTTKQVFLTIVSTFGIKRNEHSIDLIDNEIRLNALFEP